MIWHVWSGDFVKYLLGEGFRLVGKTATHDIYEKGALRVPVRRSPSLTQAEVDAISDAADLDPPKFDTWFGD